MELKLEDTVENAIAQIKSREYMAAYANSAKTVVLVGIAFGRTERNVVDWVAEG